MTTNSLRTSKRTMANMISSDFSPGHQGWDSFEISAKEPFESIIQRLPSLFMVQFIEYKVGE